MMNVNYLFHYFDILAVVQKPSNSTSNMNIIIIVFVIIIIVLVAATIMNNKK